MHPENKKYLVWLDLIRVLSIYLVIVIHVASPLYNRWSDYPFSDWMAGNIYNSFARVSVPLLFMISGYLLLQRQEDVRSFYWNRVRKVFVPLLIWSIIYLLWANNGYRTFTWFNALKAAVYALLTGPAYFHFWFVYVLFAIYLFVPIFQVFVHAADETTIRYFALIWLVFGPILDYVEQRYLYFNIAMDLGFFTKYIGYFYLGYVIGRFKFSRRSSILAGLSYIIVAIYTIYMTQMGSIIKNGYFEFYHNYLRLNLVVMSVCAFIALKSLGEVLAARWGDSALRVLRSLSSASFGIYAVHVMLWTMLQNGTFGFNLTPLTLSPYVMIPLFALLIFLLSYFFIALLQRIPYLRAIVPA